MYAKELEVATEAVRKASFLTKRIQQQIISHRDTTTITKSDDSPVTVGDYAAQTIIINTIKSYFPQDSIVGEESAKGLEESFLQQILDTIESHEQNFQREFPSDFKYTSREYPLKTTQDVARVINMGDYEGGSTGRFWCLDPIDGTKGFLRGEQFAVCLGLIVKGTVTVGCIGCPNLTLANYGGVDELPGFDSFGYIFRAVSGAGAFYSSARDHENHWVQVHSRFLTSTDGMITLEGVEKTHSSHDEQSTIKSKLGITKSVHLDSQVKYCILALGLADLYLRLPIKMSYQEKIWDHAAGNVIVLEAGGVHTDSIEGAPLDFSKGRTLLSKGVIASCGPGSLHSSVVAVSKSVIESRQV
ncbi:3'(2'),5'-bisphosphate nucleotidase KNAG_0K01100 [Huiozyma naganishii CBS 8797]|uniref:3'(2'),5'-bisphosphate nucleotidase n=1 Tax=Huiozyma naganishii (strain ATCC MYA-139 / BCRC 22969 / CBS 8797 / KCTC 17520 / NBRC 10181 / NCYC 3082 / Yp74L-3) TaxID=1071383 RepID=J7RC93_HUIN7|nr:hypothetical protein KNAG_0K01100 [Kazachstania naganishii CBS 8797]CCK72475.1 hypothetical protein KNAG_0K01100 [Kazachstania naganishii CBS 8797]